MAYASGGRRSIQLSYGRVFRSLAIVRAGGTVLVPSGHRHKVSEMSSAKRGNEAEAVILSALVKRGYEVAVPFGEGQSYDLIVDLGRRDFLRVQCKRAWPVQGCVVFNSRSTDHGRGPQSYIGLADIFGVYFPPTSAVYLVPIDAVAAFEGRLRLEPTRNNQRRLIRFAAEFEIDRWTPGSLRDLKIAVTESEPELSIA